MRTLGRTLVAILGASVWAACGSLTTDGDGDSGGATGADAGNDASQTTDAENDALVGDAARANDGAADALVDTGNDAGVEGGSEAGGDARNESGVETGTDAGGDAGNDAGAEASIDAGAPPSAPSGVAAAAVPVVSTVTTLAGSGTATFADGTGAAASFSSPYGVAVDAAGTVYVGDSGNNLIRKMTRAGVVTTLAGSGNPAFADGAGALASFHDPRGIAVDGAGIIYVADSGNHRIRKVTQAGVVTTLAGSGTATYADGTGAAASFDYPIGVALDGGTNVYVADYGNYRIRKISTTGVVTTLAGSRRGYADGTGAAAHFKNISGVALDAAGNVFASDELNEFIRKVTPAGVVTTFAGSGIPVFADGTGASASFYNPEGLAIDAAGNIYLSDTGNQRIRRLTPAGVVTTLAGSGTAAFADGKGAAASFNFPVAAAVDAAWNVYVGDFYNNRIRKLTTVGVGQLAVTWSAPSVQGGSVITGYTASAASSGQPTQTCASTGATSCTISGLTSAVVYDVSVTATNAVGTSPPSASSSGTPN